jgi:hypothetical protein
MKRGKQALIGVLVIFLVANVAAFSQTKLDWVGTSISRQNSQEMDTTPESGSSTQQGPDERGFSISDEPLVGTMNPVRAQQSGYRTAEDLSARTDTGINAISNLTIDEENGWAVSQADLELWNLKRLYVENGTFEDSTAPWTNSTYDPDGDQNQTVVHDDVEEYVSTENRGELTHVIKEEYTHYGGTEVLWSQTVNNTPFTRNFTLSLEFLYASGPLDTLGDDGLPPIYIAIFFDNDGWGWNLIDLGSRNEWYVLDDIPINLDTVGASFEFGVGLYFPYDTIVAGTEDYDDDGYADGVANAESIKVLIDNVMLVGRESPGFDEVDLKFHAEDYSTSITGTAGIGNATIANPNFWTEDPLKVEVTSNTSVSFDYRVTLLSHRYTNTSWAADPIKPGVLYSAEASQNVSLSMYTYVGTFGEYENFTITIDIPTDWENPLVYNPFLNDVTGQCIISIGRITLPTSILDRLGWWQITLEAPNYAKLISIQKYNESSGLWECSTSFRSGNTTRTQVTLGTDVSIPDLSDPVNLTWSFPNSSIWSEESLTGGFNGQVNSTSWLLGALNTSAGQWSVSVYWTNGTEVACGTASFDMYHTATLTPKHAEIQTESGLVVTNFLYYVDVDCGEYIMDEAATIEGNWSSSTLTFNPNLLHNWWETDFDTAAVGGGVHLVIVNASRPYFDNVSCQFVIESTLLTEFTLFVDSGPPIEVGLNEKHSYEFRYELLDGTGIDDAIIDVIFNPTVGLSVSNLTSTASGNYSLEIFCLQSGTYTVTVLANKSYHYVGSDSFMIEVGEFGATLSKENGSADLVSFGDNYRLVVRYANMTGYGLTGATVEIADMAPSDWIPVGSLLDDEGNGYYSILLSPSSTGTFTVVVKANFTNHETQYATFSLTVAAVPSVLVPSASGGTVSLDQRYTLQLSFEDESGIGLEGANITILSPPAGLLFYDAIYLGGGLYNVTIEPLVGETTTFEMLFRASLENYQSSTTAFSLLVRTIPTSLDILEGGSSEFMLFTEQHTLTLVYVRTDTSENVSSAHLDVFIIPSEGLNWVVRKTGVIYEVTLTAETVGKWQVFLTANKTQYGTAVTQFELEVGVMDSSINQLTLIEALVYDRTYNFTFTYLMLNGTGITDSEVVLSGFGAEWFSVTQGNPGQYMVTLIPQGIGSFEVTFSFNKDGFVAKSSAFSFSVVEVTIEVAGIQGLSGAEDQQTTISLNIVESDTEQPVTGATVVVQVIVDLVRAQSVQLTEVGEGQYSGQFIMPSSDTIAEIRIFVTLENYVLDGAYFQTELHPEMSAFALLTRTAQQYSPLLVLIGALVIGFIVQKVQSRRRKAEYIEAMAVKRRFDDIRGLVGVIVLHRSSGVPIYSKVLKGGFDDSMISGFIAAITTFRSEFEVDQREWQIIPISDIIRTVSSQNLICAFITMGSPTGTQEEMMMQFARAIGFIFDSHFENVPTRTLDDETENRFETIFDEMLDGALLVRHRTVEGHKLPRDLRLLARSIAEMDAPDEFELEELASIMTRFGLEEARAYKTIMDGIEIGYLEPINLELYTDLINDCD